ncbi:restriction endonuclease subunit S [Escherichia coli]|nr:MULTISPECIES: restriction endonuclease subunit S [Enterobacteriaceae]APW95440.1 restriction endonuclease subunit S [Escherichia coli]EFH9196154.1 restriction endonuclease subunit S [Escherichia coli]EFI0898076.1 restriction endonuclease subunit S [Escherichia coli]ELL3225193.1 restriction endonuclease subunit S [Escherichia coli]EMB0839066.1 restriction endonuclease subunit S [Escherichia coli]
MVPKGWTLGTLKDLADTIMGYAFRSEDFVPTGIPLLRMGNLYQNTLDLNRNPVYLPDSFKVDYKRFLVSPGDLVMSMTGTMGKRDYGFTVEIPSNTQCSLLNQRVLKIVPKNNASSGYILNLLRSELILSVLYSFPGGTKQANLSAKQLQELPVLIPPELEQKKIAQILSTWDKAISVTEKLLTNSQQQKKALMQQLLTGKKRLLDENGVRFSGEWQSLQISDIGTVVTGSTPPKNDSDNYGGDISWATAEDFVGKYVSNTKIKLSEQGAKKARIVPKGSILVTCIASIGKNAIADENMGTNQQINSVIVRGSNSNEFFYYQIEFNVKTLLTLAGTTAVPIINKSSFEKVSLKFPHFEEQQKIADVLSAADAEITTLQKKLACLKEEKKALMQQLLTGKRRVKVEAEEAVSA